MEKVELESTTYAVQVRCSSQLSYIPVKYYLVLLLQYAYLTYNRVGGYTHK